MKIKASNMTVRWFDGFKRTYDISEYEPGSDYLWLHRFDSSEMWIPTRQVRWFSPDNRSELTTTPGNTYMIEYEKDVIEKSIVIADTWEIAVQKVIEKNNASKIIGIKNLSYLSEHEIKENRPCCSAD